MQTSLAHAYRCTDVFHNMSNTFMFDHRVCSAGTSKMRRTTHAALHAYGSECLKCGRPNHFAKGMPTTHQPKLRELAYEDENWYAHVHVNNHKISFKIDKTYEQISTTPLKRFFMQKNWYLYSYSATHIYVVIIITDAMHRPLQSRLFCEGEEYKSFFPILCILYVIKGGFERRL